VSSNNIPSSWLHGSEDEKMVLARRVSQVICSGTKEAEVRIAENIARILLNDLSQGVRETISEELRGCKTISQEIAHRIAIDVEAVASPFLETSIAFTEEHLALLVPIVKEFARVSIAKRKHVSQQVGAALVEFSNDDTVTVLMQNKGMEMGKQVCDKMAERYESSHPNMEKIGRASCRERE